MQFPREMLAGKPGDPGWYFEDKTNRPGGTWIFYGPFRSNTLARSALAFHTGGSWEQSKKTDYFDEEILSYSDYPQEIGKNASKIIVRSPEKASFIGSLDQVIALIKEQAQRPDSSLRGYNMKIDPTGVAQYLETVAINHLGAEGEKVRIYFLLFADGTYDITDDAEVADNAFVSSSGILRFEYAYDFKKLVKFAKKLIEDAVFEARMSGRKRYRYKYKTWYRIEPRRRRT